MSPCVTFFARALPCLVLLASAPTGALAQSGETAALDKIKELNRQAIADYQAADFESAKLGLLEAIALATKEGLGDHALTARTYVHLGAVYVNGYDDRAKGQKALVTALHIRSDINLTGAVVTPALKEVFAAAQSEAKGAAGPGPSAPVAAPAPPPKPTPPPPAKPTPFGPTSAPPSPSAAEQSKAAAPKVEAPVAPKAKEVAAASEPVETAAAPEAKRRSEGPEEPDLPANIPQPLYCPNPDEAPPAHQIALRCVIQPELKVARVLLYYRTPGGEEFTPVRTVRSPKGWFNAVIPADVVVGKSLQYYFEARDPSDQVAGNAGRNDSPNLMLIREGAPPVGAGNLAMLRFQRTDDDAQVREEDPLEAVAREKRRALEASGVHRRSARSLFLGLGAGSGYGWHPKRTLEFYDNFEIQPGVTPSGLLYAIPEIGFQITDSFALSVQGRLQYITQSGSGDRRTGAPASGAVSVLGRAQYFVGQRNAQLSLSAYVGGGDMRLTIPPDGDMRRRNDSINGGPFIIGPGLGFIYHFSTHVALVLDVRALIGAPSLAIVGDAGGGLQFSF